MSAASNRDTTSLVLCSATLLPDPTRPTPESLALQVDAAKAAGFAGISLWGLHEGVARRAGRSADEVRESILGAGLSVPMVEVLMPWDAADDAAAAAAAEPTLELAERYGAKYVLAVTMRPELPPLREAAPRLRGVCARAADRGLGVVVEFLPWTGIADLATAWELVQAAGCDNSGIMVDGWHWQRQPGGPCPDLLRSIPPEFLPIFQLCDAAADPVDENLVAETLAHRCLPGEGAVDLRALLAVFDEIGAKPLIAPEVFNSALAAGGAHDMARRIYDASARTLIG